jgi:hypothetical protein
MRGDTTMPFALRSYTSAALALCLLGVEVSGCGEDSSPQSVGQGFLYYLGYSPAPLEDFLPPHYGAEYAGWDGRWTSEQMHLVGKVKQLTEVFTSFDDNRDLTLKTRTVTSFYEDGRIQESRQYDEVKSNLIKSTEFDYDGNKRLTRVVDDLPIISQEDSTAFTYDASQHLSEITYMDNGAPSETVSVTTLSDGRPVEMIHRNVNGPADWRVVYRYPSPDTIVITRYSKRDNCPPQESATFRLDKQGRPITLDYISADDLHDSNSIYRSGRYSYDYRQRGEKRIHLVMGFPRLHETCDLEIGFFPTGDVSFSHVNSALSPGFGGPGCREERAETVLTYDQIGNAIHNRVGASTVIELGRPVTRMKFDITYEYLYR